MIFLKVEHSKLDVANRNDLNGSTEEMDGLVGAEGGGFLSKGTEHPQKHRYNAKARALTGGIF